MSLRKYRANNLELVALRLQPGVKNRLVKLAASAQIRRNKVVTWAALTREAIDRYLAAEESR
jgi:hypothetical protein